MKIEREIEDGESVVRVTVRHWSAACLFLMLWLAGWSVGCYVLVVELMKKPFSCETVLFPIPFFAAEIGAIFAIFLLIFGRTVFTFRRNGATKFFGIGRVGIRKAFVFPATGELCTDEIVRTGGKHGPRTYHRLVVKTPTDVDGPCVIYETFKADVVRALCTAAKEVVGAAVAPAAERAAGDRATETAETERRDLALLADRPPKGLTVSRDLEGRIRVDLRRVRWALALVPFLVIAGFVAVIWNKCSTMPQPVMVGVGVLILLPLLRFLLMLFGRRTLVLDHGQGETFVGLGPIGVRRRFEYGGAFDVRLEQSNLYVNSERMNELVIAKPDGSKRKICASWPNDVKPYLAALIRRPAYAPASFGLGM